MDLPIQDDEVSPSTSVVDEIRFATLDDIRRQNEPQRYYDAFVCFNTGSEDQQFVDRLTHVLEDVHNLKLLVPGRDDIPGSSKYTVYAHLIDKRCRRVLLILSKAFLESPSCEFCVKFAHALEPAARSRKLIPVILDKGCQEKLLILKGLTVCDFTRDDISVGDDISGTSWDRLALSVKAPVVSV